MKFDGGFKKYILSGKGGVLAAALAAAGLLLLLFGGVGGEKTDVTPEASLEAQIAELCSATEGVGECRAMVTYGDDGEVFAVAVLCEGAESAEVRADIKELVGSLFGIGANRISVVKIKK